MISALAAPSRRSLPTWEKIACWSAMVCFTAAAVIAGIILARMPLPPRPLDAEERAIYSSFTKSAGSAFFASASMGNLYLSPRNIEPALQMSETASERDYVAIKAGLLQETNSLTFVRNCYFLEEIGTSEAREIVRLAASDLRSHIVSSRQFLSREHVAGMMGSKRFQEFPGEEQVGWMLDHELPTLRSQWKKRHPQLHDTTPPKGV